MHVSISESVTRSLDWVKVILFKRFSFAKWFVLGFCAFLAGLGEGGGGGGHIPSNTWKSGREPAGRAFQEASQWAMAHLVPLLLLVGGIFLVILAISLLLQWISSRGKFMFLDGVVHDRAEVVEPWKRFKELGNSLFIFRVVLSLIAFVILGGLVITGLAVAIPAIKAERMTAGVLTFAISGGCFFLLVVLVLALISLFLKDFVVPIMYLRNMKTVPAFRVFREEVLSGRVGTIVLFYLLKIAFAIGAGIIVFLGTCVTCCIAGLPYISSVVFLPIFVFFQCYPVFFLQQLGPGWRFFPEEQSAPEAPVTETPAPEPTPEPAPEPPQPGSESGEPVEPS